MATHDYNLANQDGASFRSDLNNALAAIVSNNSSSTAPATTFAHQIWVDTTANVIKQRNAANDAWVELWRIDGGFNAKTFSSNVTLNAQSDLRFADSDSSNWVAFQAPATVSSNVTWTLPASDGTSGQVIETNGSGVLSWADAGGVQDNITEGNTSAEVVDTGSDGHFKVVTEGTDALRVDSSQRLLVGTTSDGTGRRLQVEGTDYSNSTFSTRRESGDNGGSSIELYKSRGSSFQIVSNDDELGYIRFYGSQGSADAEAARIRVDVDGTPSATSMPGRMLFFTTPSGSTTPAERFRLGPAGQFGIAGENYGTSGQVLTSQGSGSAPQWATPAAGGKILQVVQTVKTDTSSTSSASPTAISGLSASITPTTSGNKVLVFATLLMGNASTNYGGHLYLYKGGSVITGATGDAAGSRTRSTSFQRQYQPPSGGSVAISYLDTTSGTSSITYQLYFSTESGGTVVVGRTGSDSDTASLPRCPSMLTLMEVAA